MPSPRSICLVAAALIVTLVAAPGRAWQDLAAGYVQGQVERIADPKTPADERRLATWSLILAGRASAGPLAQVARTQPRLLPTCVHLLDLVRTDALVVELFSSLLDGLPGGVKDTGELRGFIGSRLQAMLGRSFKSDAERRAFVAENVRYLVFDPPQLRFLVDEEARRKKQPMLHDPYAPSAHAEADVLFWRLLLALHLGHDEGVRSLSTADVKLVHGQKKESVRPGLDLDAFADPPQNHRALAVRDEGNGRLLYRTGDAYFFFAGAPLRCVQAGMKPIE